MWDTVNKRLELPSLLPRAMFTHPPSLTPPPPTNCYCFLFVKLCLDKKSSPSEHVKHLNCFLHRPGPSLPLLYTTLCNLFLHCCQ